MKTVGDFILTLRFRLRETKDTNWSTEGLIDAINISLAKISRDLLLYKDISVYNIEPDKVFYLLPNNKIRTIAVSIDGKPVTYKSFEWIVTNPDRIDANVLYAYETQDGMTFTQSPAGQKLTVAYNSSRRVDKETENLPLPDFAEESLMLYCLYLAYQRDMAKDTSFNKAEAYLSLYRDEVAMTKEAIKKNYNSKNITSNFQKV